MKKLSVYKLALCYGFMQALIIAIFISFLVSKYVVVFLLKHMLIISIFVALMSAIFYSITIFRLHKKREKILFSLSSTFCSILFLIVLFVIHMEFPFAFFSISQLNDADGILLIFTVGCYIIASLLLKLCVFYTSIILHNKMHGKDQSEDSSVINPDKH